MLSLYLFTLGLWFGFRDFKAPTDKLRIDFHANLP